MTGNMRSGRKLYISFNPIDVIRENNVTLTILSLGLEICHENWPANLIYKEGLINSDYCFGENILSDTTHWFYIQSAINMCEQLVTIACFDKDKTFYHGPIRISDPDEGYCSDGWKVLTKTKVAFYEVE